MIVYYTIEYTIETIRNLINKNRESSLFKNCTNVELSLVCLFNRTQIA
jgi:hypothetical protein